MEMSLHDYNETGRNIISFIKLTLFPWFPVNQTRNLVCELHIALVFQKKNCIALLQKQLINHKGMIWNQK